MGKDNRFRLSGTPMVLPIPCQRQWLVDIMNAMVDQPSPKSKKRPVAAGLFLCLVHIPPPLLDNIHGFTQPHLVEAANNTVIGKSER
jgi:hypothetical protein